MATSNNILNKYCAKCRNTLPQSAFGPNRGRYDGLAVYCKACIRDTYRPRPPIIDLLPGEEFRPVPGFEEFYSASNFGRIRRDKQVAGATSGRILKPSTSNSGYARVILSQDGSSSRHSVHRLVLSAFDRAALTIDEQVNHLNGDKLNNHIENLEWCSSQSNMAHASQTGLLAFGERNGSRLYPERLKRGQDSTRSKITDKGVTEMRNLRKQGWTYTALAERFHISWSNVRKIITRRAWRHLP